MRIPVIGVQVFYQTGDSDSVIQSHHKTSKPLPYPLIVNTLLRLYKYYSRLIIGSSILRQRTYLSAIKCYEKVSGQGGGHDEPDNCILADSRKAAFDVDRFSSISNTKTRCDEQLLPGADNLRGVAEFENTGSNDF